jgi:hypothetical protein
VTISPSAESLGIVQMACSNVPANATCRVSPGAVQLNGQPVTVDVIFALNRRSQRLRTTPVMSIHTLKINAEINGVVRSIDLPIAIER